MAKEIGMMVDSLRLGIKEGIKKAAGMQVKGIQIYAVSGETDPDNLTPGQRKDLKNFIEENGLKVAALCGDLGGHGFALKEQNASKIEKSKKIMELAKDLGTNIVTTHIGVIPEDINCERYRVMKDAFEQLGAFADSLDAYSAIETGPEKALTLKNFLDSLPPGGIRVNYDPANFVMVTGQDPVEGVHILKDYIVHTHAKDGIMIKKTDPAIIYGFFAEGGIGDMRMEDYFLETPLGLGKVDFDAYMHALDEIGYDGFLTIEREVGENPEKDILEAVQFLNSYI